MITREQKLEALEEIRRSHGGVLSPDVVIAAARNPANALHGCFDWDVHSAAMEAWRSTARTLIREVQFRVTVEKRQVRTVKYVRDPSSHAQQQGYVALDAVERRSDEARQIVEAELARIVSAIDRARGIASVLHLEDDFESLLESAVILKQKVKEFAEAQAAKRSRRTSARKPGGGRPKNRPSA